MGLFSFFKVSSQTDSCASVDTIFFTKNLPLLQIFHSKLKMFVDHDRILVSYNILLCIIIETVFNDAIDEGNYLALKP